MFENQDTRNSAWNFWLWWHESETICSSYTQNCRLRMCFGSYFFHNFVSILEEDAIFGFISSLLAYKQLRNGRNCLQVWTSMIFAARWWQSSWMVWGKIEKNNEKIEIRYSKLCHASHGPSLASGVEIKAEHMVSAKKNFYMWSWYYYQRSIRYESYIRSFAPAQSRN